MLSYFHFALSPISTKLIITHPRAARYQLARSPRIHPPTSFVPLTVPTILHPAGPFGLTCTIGLLPTFGASCAKAVEENTIATRTQKILMVIFLSPSARAVLAVNRRLAEQLSAREISRSHEGGVVTVLSRWQLASGR